MERILTVEQMRSADNNTIDNLGVSSEELIDRAGNAVASEILSRFYGGRVLVCVGKGSNGADGKVVADILSKKHGYSVVVFNVSTGMLKVFDKQYDIIVDCIFGTGLNREVNGKYRTVIEKINNSGAFVISCDIPSGLNGDNGLVMGVAVKADLTVAIQEYKLGHFLNDGIDYCGDIVLKDIGISVWEDDFIKKTNHDFARKYFDKRKRNSHKGNYGSSCVIGGSKEYSGSVILSANALCSYKMGAGYSYLVVPESLFNAYVGKVPECILCSLKDDGKNIVFDKENLDKLLKINTIAIGMGMGANIGTYETILYLLKNYNGTLIIDADGLNALSVYGKGILKNKTCKVILTPHIGEFLRLVGVEKRDILINPIQYAKAFAKEYGVVVLLKNATSIISDGDETFVNTSGCAGMAKAGSGDVLSGIIAGITARVEEITDAVAVSSYVFGKAGELAESKSGQYTMTASDVISVLPELVRSFD